MFDITNEELFKLLYSSPNEKEVDKIIQKYPDVFKEENWAPLGGNPSNFGVIENQQSNPIAALIEKLTNSIDAILMKKCYEVGINPKSTEAPQSMEEAVRYFIQMNIRIGI